MRLTTDQFLDRLKAGDPEITELVSKWKQEARQLLDSMSPDLIRFLEQDEARRKKSPDDWYQNILWDVLDETDVEILAPFIQKRIDEYTSQSPRKEGGRPRKIIYDEIKRDMDSGLKLREAMKNQGLDYENYEDREKVRKALIRRNTPK